MMTLKKTAMVLMLVAVFAGKVSAQTKMKWLNSAPKKGTAGKSIYIQGNVGSVECTQVSVYFFVQGGVFGKADYELDVDPKTGNFGGDDFVAAMGNTQYQVLIIALDSKTNIKSALSGVATSAGP